MILMVMVFSTLKMLLIKIIMILWFHNVIPIMMVLLNTVKSMLVLFKSKMTGELNTVVLNSAKLSVNVKFHQLHVKVLGTVLISLMKLSGYSKLSIPTVIQLSILETKSNLNTINSLLKIVMLMVMEI
jgi:hypothetical protein